ncbi:cobalt-precorrin-6A reductase [Roseomonas gilardii]|uniref:cobalt-precorrin-6A reductase n=1 Tax=Roseomonas gilardii TaxID=257708 RepID=UPI0011A66707|nr:cobalt-precorrin-6A reductase [Roseomonas gilardii]
MDDPSPTRILILGGSTEASALAIVLAGDERFDVVLSLAGATRSPRPQPVPVRRGGFGGASGLAEFLRAEAVDLLIDATHPFAARMSRHAVEAAELAGLPLLRIERPAWVAGKGDRWTPVPDMESAARALGGTWGETPRRVLLTVGQKELAPFQAAPWHRYVIRSIDPPDPASLPPHAAFLPGAGPFTVEAERRLLREHAIEVIVTKNSGGLATVAKLEAARELGLPVVMVSRPSLPPAENATDSSGALRWILAHHEALRGA